MNPDDEEMLRVLKEKADREGRIEAKRKKPIDSYELAKKIKSDYQKEQEYRKNLKAIYLREKERKYLSSRLGRVSSSASRAAVALRTPGGVVRAVSYRHSPARPLSRFGRMRLAAMMENSRQQQLIQNQRAVEQREFNSIFKSSLPIGLQLEKEVHSIGDIESNRECANMSSESVAFGNILPARASSSVSKDANFWAMGQHLRPIVDMENEVMSVAGMLNNIRRKRRK